ncbi:MAG: hypothetical protein LHW44_03510 [Candidatus Cloacimonetes bacterium]|nr:hypothetical protein [Candidatus Cloacimonadota bacterium]
MYKFAISYYTMEGNVRKPQSGVDVRILRPGQSWVEGQKLIENTPNSGYYEIAIESEAQCGFYEIWDDLGNTNGQFSGKTCTIGKLDARGLQNNCIYTNHILDGVVSGNKIAAGAISTEHLQSGLLSLAKLRYELQDQNQGIGASSLRSPAVLGEDKIITHTLEREYTELPQLILSSHCDAAFYIDDVKLEGNLVTVKIGVSQVYTASDPVYTLLALAM